MLKFSLFLIVIRPEISSSTATSSLPPSWFTKFPYKNWPYASSNFFYPRTPIRLSNILGLSFCSLKSVPIMTVSSKGLISKMLTLSSRSSHQKRLRLIFTDQAEQQEPVDQEPASPSTPRRLTSWYSVSRTRLVSSSRESVSHNRKTWLEPPQEASSRTSLMSTKTFSTCLKTSPRSSSINTMETPKEHSKLL